MPHAVGSSLVSTHDADPAKADMLVAADCLFVLDGRVDHHAVVAEVADDVPRERPDGIGAETVALVGSADGDIVLAFDLR